MAGFRVREWESGDRPVAFRILDEGLGAGFWDGSELERETALVAESHGTVIGVASALVRELIACCEQLGARRHLTYAWVHGSCGVAPMANVLQGAGFSFVRRVEGFYSVFDSPACPACGQSPCGCAADLYTRERS